MPENCGGGAAVEEEADVPKGGAMAACLPDEGMHKPRLEMNQAIRPATSPAIHHQPRDSTLTPAGAPLHHNADCSAECVPDSDAHPYKGYPPPPAQPFRGLSPSRDPAGPLALVCLQTTRKGRNGGVVALVCQAIRMRRVHFVKRSRVDLGGASAA